MILHQELLHADTRLETFDAAEDEAIKRISSVSWDSELAETESRKACSPTISLEYPEKEHVLWASIIGKNEFLVCFQQKAAPKGFMKVFGSQPKDVVVAQRDGIGLSALPDLFRLFYRGDFDGLEKKIKAA